MFITLGAQGVFAADEGGEFACAPAPMRLKNATGAGDAFSAVMALGCVEGQSLRRICLEGSAAAAIAAECEQTFNPALSRATLQQRIMEEPT